MKTMNGKRSASSPRWRAGCAAALLLAAIACARGEEDKAKSAVREFYNAYLKVRPSGVPTKGQQAEFKKVMSTGLSELLDEAAQSEDASRDPKSAAPPRLEGDVFTSLDEGAFAYQIVRCDVQDSSAMCVVDLTNVNQSGGGGKVSWKDRVFLVREGNRWVVDDIEYFGDKQFMHKGHLKDVLKQVIQDGKEPV
jgi:hypothetical protein